MRDLPKDGSEAREGTSAVMNVPASLPCPRTLQTTSCWSPQDVTQVPQGLHDQDKSFSHCPRPVLTCSSDHHPAGASNLGGPFDSPFSTPGLIHHQVQGRNPYSTHPSASGPAVLPSMFVLMRSPGPPFPLLCSLLTPSDLTPGAQRGRGMVGGQGSWGTQDSSSGLVP